MNVSIYSDMVVLQWIFIAFSICLRSNFVAACELKHSNKPLYGQQCVTSEPTEIWQAARPQCVWRCLWTEACRYINHNSATGQCELGFSQCEFLQPAAGVIVNIFGPPRQGCLRWGSDQEPGWVPIQERDGDIYMARTINNDALIIGNFFVGVQELWANGEGVRIGPVTGNENIEVLTKNVVCIVRWLPYTAGEPLPHGAVTGGHLADGSAVYVVKVTDNNNPFFGYYNPKSALAYYEYEGARTTALLEILILL